MESFPLSADQEAVAEQAPGRVQDEHDKLCLRDRIAVGMDRLGQPTGDRIQILDIVHGRAVGLPEAVVDEFVIDTLGHANHLARFAAVLAIDLSHRLRH